MDYKTKQQEVRRVLSSYRNYMIKIQELERQIDEISTRAYSMKSPQLSAMPRGGKPSTPYDAIDKKTDLEKRLEKMAAISTRQRQVVQAYIATVPPGAGRSFLTDYYIRRMSITEIARMNHISFQYVSRTIRDAEIQVDLSILPKLDAECG